MTDFSAEMNVGAMERVGVPSQLIGGDRPASIEAKKTFHVSPAENDVNQPGATVRFTLPNQPNTYLMPSVYFAFTATTANGPCNFDNDASSVIQRYRLYHGSQLLVDIPEYARLKKIVQDVSQSPNNGLSIQNVFENTPGKATPDPTGATQADLRKVITDVSNIPRTDPRLLANTEHEMLVPLMCPVIGSMAQKAWCSHAATAAPLRVEIDLSSNAKGLIRPAGAAAAATYSISNTELHAEYVQVSSNAQALIDQAVGGVYSLNTSSYAHTQSTIATGSTTASLLLPFSYSSAKHFLSGLYQQTEDQDHFNITGRSRANIEQVFYRVGAARVPSQPLKGDPEVAEALCKCFGVSSDLLQVCNYLQRDNFTVVAAPQPNAGDGSDAIIREGKYAMGIDLEAFGATSSATRIENGVNTTALQCFIDFTTETGQTFGANYDVHSWCCYDMLVTFANGQAYARF